MFVTCISSLNQDIVSFHMAEEITSEGQSEEQSDGYDDLINQIFLMSNDRINNLVIKNKYAKIMAWVVFGRITKAVDYPNL